MGRARTLCPAFSEIDFLCHSERIINLYAQIPRCTFNFGVTEQGAARLVGCRFADRSA